MRSLRLASTLGHSTLGHSTGRMAVKSRRVSLDLTVPSGVSLHGVPWRVSQGAPRESFTKR